MNMNRRRSRRDLLTMWTGLFRDVGESLKSSNVQDLRRILRPPGALESDTAFLEACTGCGDCAIACPTDSIVMLEIASIDKTIPVIDPSSKPCFLCADLPCIASCTAGALISLPSPSKVRMGVATVNLKRCVTFTGEACTICFKACPIPGDAIVIVGGRPVVSNAHCTGCGLCQYACPETPKAISIVPERDLVPGIRVPKDEYLAG